MRILAKTAVFTVVVPGTFSTLIPLLIASDRGATGGAAFGLALCLLTLGAVVYLWCGWDSAMSGKGTPSPIDAPTRLVTRGFYRYTRNPMYVAVLTVIAGWAILFRSLILVAYGLVVYTVFSLFIQHYEEPRLVREFGEEYAAYMERVGRWLPRCRCWTRT